MCCQMKVFFSDHVSVEDGSNYIFIIRIYIYTYTFEISRYFWMVVHEFVHMIFSPLALCP